MRQHDFLAQQPQQVTIGLHEGRSLPAQQACLHHAYIAGEQRRKQQHDQKLAELNDGVENYCHIPSTISRMTSAPNTSVR